MAPIPDLAALAPILQALQEKRLVVPLTPEGRGQVVSHTLFKEREMEQLKAQYAGGVAPPAPVSRPAATVPFTAGTAAAPAVADGVTDDVARDVAELKQQLADLKDEVAGLRREIEDLWGNLR